MKEPAIVGLLRNALAEGCRVPRLIIHGFMSIEHARLFQSVVQLERGHDAEVSQCGAEWVVTISVPRPNHLAR